MNRSQIHIFFVVLSAVMLLSCSDDEQGRAQWNGREIGFDVARTSDMPSRGDDSARKLCAVADTFFISDPDDPDYSLICTTETSDIAPTSRSMITSEQDIKSLGVVAYGNWYAPVLMDNEEYVRGSNGIFSTTSQTVKYWPEESDRRIDFYVYTPYIKDATKGNADHTAPTLSYDATSQHDLMLAVSKNVANPGGPVPLSFSHLLAGVRVLITSLPTGAKATSVSFSGVKSRGTIEMSENSPSWTLDATTKNISGTITTNAEGKQEAVLTMLPQTFTTNSVKLTVEIEEAGRTRSISAFIPASEWKMGLRTTYNISVKDYEVIFEDENNNLADAHYVIYKTILTTKDIPSYVPWTLEASASDGADVTIQYEADANEYAKNGFWTDTLDDKGNISSARGTKSISGNGSISKKSVYVFLPENVTGSDREIKFSVKIGNEVKELTGATIIQKHPAWVGDIGWEQIEESPAVPFGFKWTREVAFVYVYSAPWTLDISNKQEKYQNYCWSVIDDYDARNYAEVRRIDNYKLHYRYYIFIQYAKLNDIRNICAPWNEKINGLDVTKSLYSFSLGASTRIFENAIGNIYKTEANHQTDKAFRIGDEHEGAPNTYDEGDVAESAALSLILKKNKYDIIIKTVTVDEMTFDETQIQLNASDIKWYLPSVTDFSKASNILSPNSPADYWSSNVPEDDTNMTLKGDGSQLDRLQYCKIRACRRHP